VGEYLIAGEVKTSPADFTAKQITKDLSLAARIGADIHVMIAVYPLTSAQEGKAATLAAAPGMPAAHLLRRYCAPGRAVMTPQCHRYSREPELSAMSL
jgi:hypothetical protein